MNASQPFEPEPLAFLRQRFDRAMEGEYRIGRKSTKPCPPDSLRRHVFDFLDGLRLVVCFARVKPKEPASFYMVASFTSAPAYLAAIGELHQAGHMAVTQATEIVNGPLPGKGLHVKLDGREMIDWIEGHFRALCQWSCPLTFGFVDGQNIFHFAGPTRQEYRAMRQDALNSV